MKTEIISFGKVKSFLSASHVSRARYTHHVTVASLHIVVTKAYESYTVSTETSSSFLCWKEKEEKEYPQFHYWSTTFNFEFIILMFVFLFCSVLFCFVFSV